VDEQIFKGLLELYAKRGIDLTNILNDPMVVRMDIGPKIQLIKQYAEYISSHTSKQLDKRDIKSMIIDSAMGGGVAGLAGAAGSMKALQFFGKGSSVHWPSIGAIALTGAGIGFGGALLKSIHNLQSRREMVKSFKTVADDPTDSNAVQVLGTNFIKPRELTRDSILEKVIRDLRNQENNLTNPSNAEIVPHYKTMYHNVMNDVEMNPTRYKTEEEKEHFRSTFSRIYDKSEARYNNLKDKDYL